MLGWRKEDGGWSRKEDRKKERKLCGERWVINKCPELTGEQVRAVKKVAENSTSSSCARFSTLRFPASSIPACSLFPVLSSPSLSSPHSLSLTFFAFSFPPPRGVTFRWQEALPAHCFCFDLVLSWSWTARIFVWSSIQTNQPWPERFPWCTTPSSKEHQHSSPLEWWEPSISNDCAM